MKRLLILASIPALMMTGLVLLAMAVPTNPRVAAQEQPKVVQTTPAASPAEKAQHHSQVRSRAWQKFYSKVGSRLLRRIH